MTRVNLVKHGFVKWPEESFSDDGSRFNAYKVGERVRVTKCLYKGKVFLNGTIRTGLLTFYDFMKLPHYKDLSRLNGVDIKTLTDEDLIKLYNDCIEFEKEYTAKEFELHGGGN
jgi:hypothetical protein